METLFSQDRPILDLHLCADNKTLTYNLGDEMFLQEIGGNTHSMGPGKSLRRLSDSGFICCREDQLITLSNDQKPSPVKAKGNLLKTLSKGYVNRCHPNRDGSLVACAIGGITRPDVWGSREYCGVVDLKKSTFEVFDLEIFGGEISFAHTDDALLLNVLDVKGGSIYLMDLDGSILGQFIGMAPALSPSGKQLAFRSENMVSVALFDGSGWKLTDRFSQPESGLGNNFNPPVWFDEQNLAYDSGDVIYRFDLSKNNAKTVEQIPGLVIRRQCTMVGGPGVGLLVLVATQGSESAIHFNL